MSQHDYTIDNQTGAATRADLNNALGAIVTQNSGATAPATTFAYMLWADTTANKLKQRNAANSGWIELWDFSSSNAGSLIGALGSLSSCGFQFFGDPNTGFYSTGADAMLLVAGGVAYFEVSAANGARATGTAALTVPVGTTAQRPTGANGMVRYNSDLGKFEGYAGTWKDLGGGGGGAGFVWRALSGLAPLSEEENGEQVWQFESGQNQELYASIKVPQSYAAGTQILVYVSAYSPSSSNTFLLSAQSTLIRTGTDAFTSTTNQRTTTNAALTNTVANMLREVVLDVTDSSGQINGVAVTAGHIIKLRLYRGSGTDTATIRVVGNATDVKFT